MDNKKLIISIFGVALLLASLFVFKEITRVNGEERQEDIQVSSTEFDNPIRDTPLEVYAPIPVEIDEDAEIGDDMLLLESKRAMSEQESQGVVTEASYDTYQPTSGLTRECGVNYYNGQRETWYSSNVLYHYRTSEWTVGEDGVYRDADGYVVVARSDMAQGDTIETSLGTGRVYDTGCAAGTTDIYTSW